MKAAFSILFYLILNSAFGQVSDSVVFNDKQRLGENSTCQEVKDKEIYLDNQYLLKRKEAQKLASMKSKRDYPCYWYDVKFLSEERFSYKLEKGSTCIRGRSSKAVHCYKFKFYVIRIKSQPLVTGTSSGYINCDQELLRNLPAN